MLSPNYPLVSKDKLKRMTSFKNPLLIFYLSVTIASCSRTTPLALFRKLSPHDAYGQRLKDAGLNHTAMGGAWLQVADQSVVKPLTITIPYKETGYFAADKVQTSVLRFEARRGQKLHVVLSKRPELNFAIYMDIFQEQSGSLPKLVASADTVGLRLDYEVPKNGGYLIRVQPELLRSGEYTLTVTAGPSLSFPVAASGNPHIGSFWGDGRDEGSRRHEGVDIFAPKHTLAIAAADGVVSRVTNNTLGGKVVFFKPDGRDYDLYYAHLDSQLVRGGQVLRTGDAVGWVGNTGNAKFTPSHLHFGIYTSDGAVDPLPFVNRETKAPSPVVASEKMLNATAHTSGNTARLRVSPSAKAAAITALPANTILTVDAATQSWYKITLPDGRTGYLHHNELISALPIRKHQIKMVQPLYDRPDSTAARKLMLEYGSYVYVLGSFNNFYLVSDSNENSGWIQAK